ncbi:MAG: non-homologous end-joining DNA ligase [Bacteroidota bacterium]|nr:non-homologous end-joining DNA ligase [Bacteroidota bacterium]
MLRSAGKQIKLTNQNKIYWPKDQITKGDLIDYYDRMHKFILPYLKDRPQSLKRNPGGITDKGFYQKDANDHTPEWIHTERLASKNEKGSVNYIICNDRATLLYLANLGCIEMNPWSSRYDRPDHPDHIVIDLDPGDATTFDQVVEAALAVKVICDAIGAQAFCKTSGASGLHIYLPTKARYTYADLAILGEGIALCTQALLPKTTTVERTIAKRGGKLYLDYLQNRKGQTLASAYSVRPVEGATVSTPLDWSEVRPGLDKNSFTMRTIPSRVERRGDLFSGVLGKGLDLKKCLKALEAFE